MGSFFFAGLSLSLFKIPITLSLGAWFWVTIGVIVLFTGLGIFV
jgi:hypothetical protein